MLRFQYSFFHFFPRRVHAWQLSRRRSCLFQRFRFRVLVFRHLLVRNSYHSQAFVRELANSCSQPTSGSRHVKSSTLSSTSILLQTIKNASRSTLRVNVNIAVKLVNSGHSFPREIKRHNVNNGFLNKSILECSRSDFSAATSNAPSVGSPITLQDLVPVGRRFNLAPLHRAAISRSFSTASSFASRSVVCR